jgi:putative thiamine transport system ATP-binding protein
MSLVLDAIAVTHMGHAILKPFSGRIEGGEIVTVMGRSGSGKTSLLSAIAGDLPQPLQGSGQIFLNEKDITLLRPEQRRIGRLFQDDFLFPHLSVAENLLFGMARGPKPDRMAIVTKVLERAELSGFEDRAPHTLSGGQRSRVALMRALLAKPDAMLLDEPFAKLDTDLRASIRDYTFGHLRAGTIPTLLVTHDLEDVPKGGRVIYV